MEGCLGEESFQMWELNRRLEAYLGRVKALEEQNELLGAELAALRAQSAEASWRARADDELAALRGLVDQRWREKHAAEVERDNLAEELEGVAGRCQQVRLARERVAEEAARHRRALETEQCAQGWLGSQAAELERELEDLRAAHEEERASLNAQAACAPRGPAPPRGPPARAPEVEELARRLGEAWRGAVRGYQERVAHMETSLGQARERLGHAVQGAREGRLELQQLRAERGGLQERRAALEQRLEGRWQERLQATEKFQLAVEALEQEKQGLQSQIAQVLEGRQQLAHLKMSLSLEVATYRTLLEAENERLQAPGSGSKTSLGFQDPKLELRFPGTPEGRRLGPLLPVLSPTPLPSPLPNTLETPVPAFLKSQEFLQTHTPTPTLASTPIPTTPKAPCPATCTEIRAQDAPLSLLQPQDGRQQAPESLWAEAKAAFPGSILPGPEEPGGQQQEASAGQSLEDQASSVPLLSSECPKLEVNDGEPSGTKVSSIFQEGKGQVWGLVEKGVDIEFKAVSSLQPETQQEEGVLDMKEIQDSHSLFEKETVKVLQEKIQEAAMSVENQSHKTLEEGNPGYLRSLEEENLETIKSTEKENQELLKSLEGKAMEAERPLDKEVPELPKFVGKEDTQTLQSLGKENQELMMSPKDSIETVLSLGKENQELVRSLEEENLELLRALEKESQQSLRPQETEGQETWRSIAKENQECLTPLEDENQEIFRPLEEENQEPLKSQEEEDQEIVRPPEKENQEPSRSLEEDQRPLEQENQEPLRSVEEDQRPLEKEEQEPLRSVEEDQRPLEQENQELLRSVEEEDQRPLEKENQEPLRSVEEEDQRPLEKENQEPLRSVEEEDQRPLEKENQEPLRSVEEEDQRPLEKENQEPLRSVEEEDQRPLEKENQEPLRSVEEEDQRSVSPLEKENLEALSSPEEDQIIVSSLEKENQESSESLEEDQRIVSSLEIENLEPLKPSEEEDQEKRSSLEQENQEPLEEEVDQEMRSSLEQENQEPLDEEEQEILRSLKQDIQHPLSALGEDQMTFRPPEKANPEPLKSFGKEQEIDWSFEKENEELFKSLKEESVEVVRSFETENLEPLKSARDEDLEILKSLETQEPLGDLEEINKETTKALEKDIQDPLGSVDENQETLRPSEKENQKPMSSLEEQNLETLTSPEEAEEESQMDLGEEESLEMGEKQQSLRSLEEVQQELPQSPNQPRWEDMEMEDQTLAQALPAEKAGMGHEDEVELDLREQDRKVEAAPQGQPQLNIMGESWASVSSEPKEQRVPAEGANGMGGSEGLQDGEGQPQHVGISQGKPEVIELRVEADVPIESNQVSLEVTLESETVQGEAVGGAEVGLEQEVPEVGLEDPEHLPREEVRQPLMGEESLETQSAQGLEEPRKDLERADDLEVAATELPRTSGDPLELPRGWEEPVPAGPWGADAPPLRSPGTEADEGTQPGLVLPSPGPSEYWPPSPIPEDAPEPQLQTERGQEATWGEEGRAEALGKEEGTPEEFGLRDVPKEGLQEEEEEEESREESEADELGETLPDSTPLGLYLSSPASPRWGLAGEQRPGPQGEAGEESWDSDVLASKGLAAPLSEEEEGGEDPEEEEEPGPDSDLSEEFEDLRTEASHLPGILREVADSLSQVPQLLEPAGWDQDGESDGFADEEESGEEGEEEEEERTEPGSEGEEEEKERTKPGSRPWEQGSSVSSLQALGSSQGGDLLEPEAVDVSVPWDGGLRGTVADAPVTAPEMESQDSAESSASEEEADSVPLERKDQVSGPLEMSREVEDMGSGQEDIFGVNGQGPSFEESEHVNGMVMNGLERSKEVGPGTQGTLDGDQELPLQEEEGEVQKSPWVGTPVHLAPGRYLRFAPREVEGDSWSSGED
ncbi:nestin isoform X3 [Perognathus longimembris pacificus]|uniref:nestin isoform X3 n=1 Tax=Perognathus longimembris pacificus TaxID=214514 RepID=UPI0020199F6B|nr:nestin isoform X3 [Perognathus longimembris pacificus]